MVRVTEVDDLQLRATPYRFTGTEEALTNIRCPGWRSTNV